MAKLPLSQGAYQARGVIANAQTCINLYPEPNTQDAPFPMTLYPAPGLSVQQDFSGYAGATGGVRGLYDTSRGEIVVVIGTAVFDYNPGRTGSPVVPLGQLVSNTGLPVSICDNGTTVVIVDGSVNGYMVPATALGTPGSLQQITDPNFLGSPRVDFIDTFLIFTQPGTGNFYSSLSNVVQFDPLYFAAKEGWNDLLVTAVCLHDNIWLLGNSTTEIWFNAGGAAFPFARMPNSILQQGCVATYSAVVADNAVYWLSQDRWGRNMCMRGEGYAAKRVSTFAVEDVWSKYPIISDAVGMAFQLGGHETICFYFPSGNAWWAYDASTQQWHQRTYNGYVTAWLPYCMAGWGAIAFVGAANAVLAGDRTGPRLLQISRNNYTDEGVPIARQRSWAHVQADGNRVYHSRFSASMSGSSLAQDTVSLSWSDDAGQTYGTPVPQTIGNATNGQYQWRRLGYARDRVYRLDWQGAGECALNGAWIDTGQGAT